MEQRELDDIVALLPPLLQLRIQSRKTAANANSDARDQMGNCRSLGTRVRFRRPMR